MPQQLAKLLLLWRREEEVNIRGVRSGVLRSLLVRITPFRMSKGVMALLSPCLSMVPIFMIDANDSF